MRCDWFSYVHQLTIVHAVDSRKQEPIPSYQCKFDVPQTSAQSDSIYKKQDVIDRQTDVKTVCRMFAREFDIVARALELKYREENLACAPTQQWQILSQTPDINQTHSVRVVYEFDLMYALEVPRLTE